MRGPIATRVITQLVTATEWGALDYLIVDMPPGTLQSIRGNSMAPLFDTFFLYDRIFYVRIWILAWFFSTKIICKWCFRLPVDMNWISDNHSSQKNQYQILMEMIS